MNTKKSQHKSFQKQPIKNSKIGKKTQKINEAFICEKCNTHNPEAEKTCRNHCYACLYSKHVDEKVPGDRQSKCHGLMAPISVDYKSKKGYQILHECLICNKKILNKTSPDDNQVLLTKIMQMQNMDGS